MKSDSPKWRKKIVACHNSGLGIRKWYRQEGISKETYYRHGRMIIDRMKNP